MLAGEVHPPAHNVPAPPARPGTNRTRTSSHLRCEPGAHLFTTRARAGAPLRRRRVRRGALRPRCAPRGAPARRPLCAERHALGAPLPARASPPRPRPRGRRPTRRGGARGPPHRRPPAPESRPLAPLRATPIVRRYRSPSLSTPRPNPAPHTAGTPTALPARADPCGRPRRARAVRRDAPQALRGARARGPPGDSASSRRAERSPRPAQQTGALQCLLAARGPVRLCAQRVFAHEKLPSRTRALCDPRTPRARRRGARRTDGLAHTPRQALWALLRERRTGAALLLTTHSMAEARSRPRARPGWVAPVCAERASRRVCMAAGRACWRVRPGSRSGG